MTFVQLKEFMEDQHFDSCSVGVLDFSQKTFETFHCLSFSDDIQTAPYFDLASITKPFTLGALALIRPELFKEEQLQWLLNHRAGLPSGGRLSRCDWREQVSGYSLKWQNQDLYSDYSALRLMLELEQRTGQKLYELAQVFWDQEIIHWLKITDNFSCRPTGFRLGKVIQGEVNDDNAFVLKEELSHAGLFGTIEGVCRTLLNLSVQSQNFALLREQFKTIKENERFILGFDRVQNPQDTLAGIGCSSQTFGHLGFTGTSFWCDLEKNKGWVLLSNATPNYSYDRQGLKALRQGLGQLIWQS